ncbi:MAG: BcsR/BcsP family cellulose biosynthesis protein [Methylococcaceae bacterium]|nr:BcsR/BcsP family cellulose biosynthesis protein [Methylococcaceae bacterium]
MKPRTLPDDIAALLATLKQDFEFREISRDEEAQAIIARWPLFRRLARRQARVESANGIEKSGEESPR